MILKDRIWFHQDSSLPVSFPKTIACRPMFTVFFCTELRTNQCSWYKDLRKTPCMGGRVACDESEMCFFRFGPNEMWWFLKFLKVCWVCLRSFVLGSSEVLRNNMSCSIHYCETIWNVSMFRIAGTPCLGDQTRDAWHILVGVLESFVEMGKVDADLAWSRCCSKDTT